jgi:hypothetical protein
MSRVQPLWTEFYKRTQAKLFYAVVNQTPSEVLKARASADAPNMGLQSWSKGDIRQSDAVVAKNYLAPAELKELNRLTTILLDIFDDQFEIGRLVLMGQAVELLDQQLTALKRMVLHKGGGVRHDDAEARAKAEYKVFDERRRLARREETDNRLVALKHADKALPKVRSLRPRPQKP